MLEPDPVLGYGTDLCNALTDRGVDVVLVTARGYQHQRRARFRFVAVAPESGTGRYLAKLASELEYVGVILKMLLRWRPDVVHFQWFRLRVELLLLAAIRAFGVRVVWTAHNVLPHELRRGDIVLHRVLYRLASHVITHTKQGAQSLTSSFGVSPKRIHVVPIGNSESTALSVIPSDQARQELEIPRDATVYLFYGQFRPYKGYDELLTAFEVATRRCPRISLVLAGRAPHSVAKDIQRRLSSMEDTVRQRIVWRPAIDAFVDQVTTDLVFSAADCVVLPYREVSQSAVLMQAFAYGRPVLGTAAGGFLESIRDGETGFLFPAGDVNALARRLEELGSQRERLAACGARAKEYAAVEHSWARCAALTIDAYRTVLENQAEPLRSEH